jgi:hypothetical protein
MPLALSEHPPAAAETAAADEPFMDLRLDIVLSIPMCAL